MPCLPDRRGLHRWGFGLSGLSGLHRWGFRRRSSRTDAAPGRARPRVGPAAAALPSPRAGRLTRGGRRGNPMRQLSVPAQNLDAAIVRLSGRPGKHSSEVLGHGSCHGKRSSETPALRSRTPQPQLHGSLRMKSSRTQDHARTSTSSLRSPASPLMTETMRVNA